MAGGQQRVQDLYCQGLIWTIRIISSWFGNHFYSGERPRPKCSYLEGWMAWRSPESICQPAGISFSSPGSISTWVCQNWVAAAERRFSECCWQLQHGLCHLFLACPLSVDLGQQQTACHPKKLDFVLDFFCCNGELAGSAQNQHRWPLYSILGFPLNLSIIIER